MVKKQQKYESEAALEKTSISNLNQAETILKEVNDKSLRARIALEFLKKDIYLGFSTLKENYSEAPRKILRDQILAESIRLARENEDQEREFQLLKLGGLNLLVAQILFDQKEDKQAREVLLEEYLPPHGVEVCSSHFYRLVGLNLINHGEVKDGAEILGVSGWRWLALEEAKVKANPEIRTRFKFLKEMDPPSSYASAMHASFKSGQVHEVLNSKKIGVNITLDEAVSILLGNGAIVDAINILHKHHESDHAIELATQFLEAACTLDEIASAIKSFKTIAPTESKTLHSILEKRGFTPVEPYLLYSEGKKTEANVMFEELKDPPIAVKYSNFDRFLKLRREHKETSRQQFYDELNLSQELISAERLERKEPGSLTKQINKIIDSYKKHEYNEERAWTTALGGVTSHRVAFLHEIFSVKTYPRADDISLQNSLSHHTSRCFKQAYFHGLYGISKDIDSLLPEAADKAKCFKLKNEELILRELLGEFPRAKVLAESLGDSKKLELYSNVLALLGN